MKKLLLITLFTPFLSYSIENVYHSSSATKQNFSNAKKRLVKVYNDHPEEKTFYCGCQFTFEGNKGIVDLASCGYKIRKNEIRANRIEWEHVMPAHHFGSQLQCWQNGGRKNCAKVPTFNVMEGDMHNLRPAIGEVNADRSNFGYSQFTRVFDQYGQCQSAVDFKNRKFQPRDEVKGEIARTYFYMANKYKVRLSKQDRQLMEAWDKMYPPTTWECERNQIITKIQGNDNPYITQSCNKSN